MIHDWRALLYPIGLLASLGFGTRFFIQWLLSEKKKQSTVTPLFWNVSLTAHSLMALHSIIQIQYPLAIIQSLNAIIAYRNIDLMGKNRLCFKKSLLLLALTAFSVTLFFTLQSLFFTHNFEWMGAPHMPWDSESTKQSLSFGWQAIGLLGIFFFASRFWIQWWFAEKNLKSELNELFWWISLFGAALSTVYFIKLLDVVNILSYATGLIPYIRNLVLIRKRKAPVDAIKNSSQSLFIFAGESSGDLIGASLLKKLAPHFTGYSFYGVAGPSMRELPFEQLMPMEDFKVMGFSAVIKALPKLFRSLKLLEKNILKNRPEAVILIDYADFNMRLAKALRKKGYQGKIVHYVCPSVWAWKKDRVHQLAKTLDLLLAIFPFEPSYFEKTSLPVKYVGHPLARSFERPNPQVSTQSTTSSANLQSTLQMTTEPSIHRVGLFPGSRMQEIILNLPIQLQSAQHAVKLTKKMQIFISCADEKYHSLIQKLIKKSAPELAPICKIILANDKESLFKNIDVAIAKSGTITLELAFQKIPSVVTYKLSRFNYLIAKYLIKIRLPFYCIVNIVAGQKIFPEFVDYNLKPREIADALLRFFQKNDFSHCQNQCNEVYQKLYMQNSSETAAQEIKSLLKMHS